MPKTGDYIPLISRNEPLESCTICWAVVSIEHAYDHTQWHLSLEGKGEKSLDEILVRPKHKKVETKSDFPQHLTEDELENVRLINLEENSPTVTISVQSESQPPIVLKPRHSVVMPWDDPYYKENTP